MRTLPVAFSIAVASVRRHAAVGARSATRSSSRGGLALIGVAFVWVRRRSVATPYLEIVGQMVVLGVGLGLDHRASDRGDHGCRPARRRPASARRSTTPPASSAATLGVAVIGSVFASIYVAGVHELDGSLPAGALDASTDSIGAALLVAEGLGPAGEQLRSTASAAFFDGFQIGCLVAAGVLLVGSVFAARFLPSRPVVDLDDVDDVDKPVPVGASEVRTSPGSS